MILLLLHALAMTTGIVVAVDYAGPYRPYSAELKADEDQLKGFNESEYARMSLEDPQLKLAYAAVFGSSINGGFYNLPPEVFAALADLRKRGDTVTPMLLQLMGENQETGFELHVLASIPAVGTIKIDPYLDYARHVLRERTQTMSAMLAGCASNLLAEHGTKEDAELMRWVMEQRPWLADSVTRKLDELNRRLNLPKQEVRAPLKGRPIAAVQSQEDSRSVGQKAPATSSNKEQEVTRWIVWPLAILVAGGLVRMLLKNRK